MVAIFGKIIKEKDKEIALLEHRQVVSTQDLSFTYGSLEDWMERLIKSVHIEKVGSEVWCNTFVQLLDYLADPTIHKKNQNVLNDLKDFTFSLETNPDFLGEIQNKI